MVLTYNCVILNSGVSVMATWVTHLMIADMVLERFPWLDRRGFCVGNIAPDCNVENADWTAFTPPRSVTHWMSGDKKVSSDCDRFCEKYITERRTEIRSAEEYAFLLGYYAHLLTDAAFQAMIRDDNRVKAAWCRLKEYKGLTVNCVELPETWDSIKAIFPKKGWMKGVYSIEAEYLHDHPDSGYLTDILSLEGSPDYIDYLPTGCILRKIGIMGYLPKDSKATDTFLAISREEYKAFVENTANLVVERFKEYKLITNMVECVWEHNGNDTLLYAVNLPGAYTRGNDLAVAVSKMKQEAQNWLDWSGRGAAEEIEIRVVQDAPCSLQIFDADSDVLFNTEKNPLTMSEYTALKALCMKSANDFQILYDSVPDKDKSDRPIRTTFYGQVPRTAREMYTHTKNVNAYYFGEINVVADNDGTIVECRQRGFEALEGKADYLNNRVVEGSYGELWTLRKTLRRFLWHDRIHAKAMYRAAVRMFGEDAIADPFCFGEV